jgi:hypothetical protein
MKETFRPSPKLMMLKSEQLGYEENAKKLQEEIVEKYKKEIIDAFSINKKYIFEANKDGEYLEVNLKGRYIPMENFAKINCASENDVHKKMLFEVFENNRVPNSFLVLKCDKPNQWKEKKIII